LATSAIQTDLVISHSIPISQVSPTTSTTNMTEVVIVSAARTPIGGLNGSLSTLKSHELGSAAITGALIRANIRPDEVDDVIMGQVLVAGQGMNPARQAAVQSQIPYQTPAATVSMVCGSGLRSVVMGCQAIKSGDAGIVVAGGQESMSGSAHAIHMRNGVKFGNAELRDTMITDGLTDAFSNIHMGITAENIAKEAKYSQSDQDAFAYQSQMKCKSAQEAGHFDQEIVSVSIPGRKGTTTLVAKDEQPRPETTLEGLGKLRPAFIRDGTGSVTAGNASTINDGAAAVILMSAEEAKSRGLTPMGRVVSSACAGVDPKVMGKGPIPAVSRALEKAGWNKDSVDLFELNEAFAAQSMCVVDTLAIDRSKVNVQGGAIALGHPIGASGCRILVTLLHTMQRLGKKRGVASLCIGGGMGIAVCVEA